MSHAFLESLWIAAPVLLGGLVHIAVIKTGAFAGLARIPLDGRRCFRGHRVFGDNKTLRGAVVVIAATLVLALLQAPLVERFGWAREASPVDYHSVSPIAWGLMLGLGYVLGELPNSFLKRQLGIAPGQAARGGMGALFWFMDQVDSLVGVLFCLALIWQPSLAVVIALLAVALAIHPAASLLMCRLGLKTRVG